MLSGSQITAGYWRNPEMTGECFFEDAAGAGWQRTGELFAQDEEGFLYFLSRPWQFFSTFLLGCFLKALALPLRILKNTEIELYPPMRV